MLLDHLSPWYWSFWFRSKLWQLTLYILGCIVLLVSPLPDLKVHWDTWKTFPSAPSLWYWLLKKKEWILQFTTFFWTYLWLPPYVYTQVYLLHSLKGCLNQFMTFTLENSSYWYIPLTLTNSLGRAISFHPLIVVSYSSYIQAPYWIFIYFLKTHKCLVMILKSLLGGSYFLLI